MKKTGNLIVFIFLIAIAISCKKEQKLVKHLDGVWNATTYSRTDNGITLDFVKDLDYTLLITFDHCKIEEAEGCECTWVRTKPDGNKLTLEFLYSFYSGNEQEVDVLNFINRETFEIEIASAFDFISKKEILIEFATSGFGITTYWKLILEKQ